MHLRYVNIRIRVLVNTDSNVNRRFSFCLMLHEPPKFDACREASIFRWSSQLVAFNLACFSKRFSRLLRTRAFKLKGDVDLLAAFDKLLPDGHA